MAIASSNPRFFLQKNAEFPRILIPKKVLNSISKSKPSVSGCQTRGALSGEQSQDLRRHVDYLHEHFAGFCDVDRGIDLSMFDDHIVFSDPITKHDTIYGYLLNFRMVNAIFHPEVQVLSARQVMFFFSPWIDLIASVFLFWAFVISATS